jgi:hypothetical protein
MHLSWLACVHVGTYLHSIVIGYIIWVFSKYLKVLDTWCIVHRYVFSVTTVGQRGWAELY